MNSPGSQFVFSAVTGAATSGTYTVDNDRIILVEVATSAVAASSQRLYVYGSIGQPADESKPIDPNLPQSVANPYSPLLTRDLNDMGVVVGNEGLPLTSNMFAMYEINVSAVRDVHFKLTGGPGTAVTVRLRSYRNV